MKRQRNEARARRQGTYARPLPTSTSIPPDPAAPSPSLESQPRVLSHAGITVPLRPLSTAEQELLEDHLHLVRAAVERAKLKVPAYVDADDLYSVGVTGLIAAVRHFDPDRGRTFSSYAATRIRGAILDELRRSDWCSQRARACANKLKRAINEIEQKFGRAARDEEVRAVLGIDVKKYTKWVERSKPVRFVALDRNSAAGAVGGGALPDAVSDESDLTGRDVLDRSELHELVTQRIAELPDMLRKVLAMYYFQGMRQGEIGAVFGLTESSICKIHARAIRSLRTFLERRRNH